MESSYTSISLKQIYDTTIGTDSRQISLSFEVDSFQFSLSKLKISVETKCWTKCETCFIQTSSMQRLHKSASRF